MENTEENEEYIRPPDTVVRETLVDNTVWTVPSPDIQYQRELELALTKSLAEEHFVTDETTEAELARVLQSSKEEYDAEIQKYVEEIFQQEQEKRRQRFPVAKTQLTRLARMDKANEKHYTILLEIIQKYEEGYTEYGVVDDEMEYMEMMRIIKTMRLNKMEQMELCGFLRCQSPP
jgi:hypothetical protein